MEAALAQMPWEKCFRSRIQTPEDYSSTIPVFDRELQPNCVVPTSFLNPHREWRCFPLPPPLPLPLPLSLSLERSFLIWTFPICVFHRGLWHFDRWGGRKPLLNLEKKERKVIMPDIQVVTHTIRSHGTKVARFHVHDWVILLILGIIDIILNVIEPFHRFVGKDMMADLRYPLKSNTIPFWAVPLIGVVLPSFIFIGVYFKKKNVYDLHNAILGLLFSVLITGVLTDAIKDAVGRPRPDFFWRCFPDGHDLYDNFTTSVICHGDKSVIKEGHKSFPSGHSSWSFAGLGFLAWYLAGKIKVFNGRGHVAKLCIILLPLLCASLIAISRVDDYWHHWQDVFTGGTLGLMIASICYLQFFPPPYHVNGWGPHAYFRVLAELPDGGAPSTATNGALSVRPVEFETFNIGSQGLLNFAARDFNQMPHDMESAAGDRRE